MTPNINIQVTINMYIVYGFAMATMQIIQNPYYETGRYR